MNRRLILIVPCVLCCALLALGRGRDCQGQGYTPESEEVKTMVLGAVKFIEGESARISSEAEKALAAYAIMKAQLCYQGAIDPSNPFIQEALRAVLEKGTKDSFNYTYAMSVKLLFLAALDRNKYRPEIDQILAELIARQKEHGGWGYTGNVTGDTSMSQMAVLSLWELEHHGIVTPDAAWEKSIGWFMRTQDPSGAYGYQGVEGAVGALKPQNEMRESLTAGAAGSLYIVLDHINRGNTPHPSPTPEAGPDPALREKDPEEQPGERAKVNVNVDRAALQTTMQSVDTWLKDSAAFPPKAHLFYYLYALERYHAFKDKAEGHEESPGGDWYDRGVTYLISRAGNNSTGFRGEHAPAVDTAFCILFLVRSSQLSIKAGPPDLAGGELRGRRGGVAEINDPNSQQARPRPLKGPADEILNTLANPDDPNYDNAVAALTELSISADDATLSKVAVQLRNATKDPSPEARASALRALARTRDLDNVPALLFCLRDPEWLVAQQAHEGLRFISRRLSSVPVDLPEGGPELDAAIRDWKDWFLAIRPDAELEE